MGRQWAAARAPWVSGAGPVRPPALRVPVPALAACPAFVCSPPQRRLLRVSCGGSASPHRGFVCSLVCLRLRVSVGPAGVSPGAYVVGPEVCSADSASGSLGLTAQWDIRLPAPQSLLGLRQGFLQGSVQCGFPEEKGGERATFPLDLGDLGAGPRQMAFPLLV